jgi:hypothetical protein
MEIGGDGSLAKLALNRRAIQIALGCLWILDGLLKFQPDLWHDGFAKTVIAPNALGQPTPWGWLITHVADLVLHGQAAWVIVFGIIGIAFGLALLFRSTVRMALVASTSMWWRPIRVIERPVE